MLRLKLIYVRKRATKICLNKLQELLTFPLVKCWIIETEWCIYVSAEQAIIGSDNGFTPLVDTLIYFCSLLLEPLTFLFAEQWKKFKMVSDI